MVVNNGNYIGALVTFCIRQNLPRPEFFETQPGRDVFLATVTFSYNGTFFYHEGVSRRKRVAKQLAAKKLWTGLQATMKSGGVNNAQK